MRVKPPASKRARHRNPRAGTRTRGRSIRERRRGGGGVDAVDGVSCVAVFIGEQVGNGDVIGAC